ncbi:MAG: B12-binding domain-containing radical SAM protein, partial [Candidatus Methylomirabilis sp.]|nr:B12-binding domain-containing radical SAM protein [Deltaproteobacteria bacterium]
LRVLKDAKGSPVTVIGGPHPSAEGMLAQSFAFFGDTLDYAFDGEGEIGFPKLVRRLETGEGDLAAIEGLGWREGGEVRHNPPVRWDDLDTLEWPAWDLLMPETYPPRPLGGFCKKHPLGYVLASRGCPYDCTFCAGRNVYGKTVRWRSPEKVIEELRYLKEERGIQEFHILDDNFTFNPQFVMEFCERYIASGLKMPWNCSSGIRLDFLDDRVVSTMVRAGCYSGSVGIESGSERIIKDMKKATTREKMRDKVRLLRSHGMFVTGLFIVGYPTETREDIEETIRYAKTLDLTRATFTTFVPLPGTESWELLQRTGKLKELDWGTLSYYTTQRSYMDGVDSRELGRLQQKAFLSFYGRPRQLWYMLRSIQSPQHLRAILYRMTAHWRNFFNSLLPGRNPSAALAASRS